MILYVCNIIGREFGIDCERTTTIDEVKEKFAAASNSLSSGYPGDVFLITNGRILSNEYVIPSLSKEFSSVGRVDFGKGNMCTQHVYFLNEPDCWINLFLPFNTCNKDVEFLINFFDFMKLRFHEKMEKSESFTGEYIYRLKCGDEVVAERTFHHLPSFSSEQIYYRHIRDFYPRKDIWSFGIYFVKNRTLDFYNIQNGSTIYALDKKRHVTGKMGPHTFILPYEFIKHTTETQGALVKCKSEKCRTTQNKIELTKKFENEVDGKSYALGDDLSKKSTELLSYGSFDFPFVKTKNLGVFRSNDFDITDICSDCLKERNHQSPNDTNTLYFRKCSWKISSIITDPDTGYPKRKEIGWNCSNGEEDDDFKFREFLEQYEVQELQVKTRFYCKKDDFRGKVFFRNLGIEENEYFNPDLSYCMYCGIFEGSLSKIEECEHYAHKECFKKWDGNCLRCKLESQSGIIGMDVVDEYLKARIQFVISNHDDFVEENELESLRFSGENFGFKISKTLFLL